MFFQKTARRTHTENRAQNLHLSVCIEVERERVSCWYVAVETTRKRHDETERSAALSHHVGRELLPRFSPTFTKKKLTHP